MREENRASAFWSDVKSTASPATVCCRQRTWALHFDIFICSNFSPAGCSKTAFPFFWLMIWGICLSSSVLLQPAIASESLAFPNPHQLLKNSLQDHSWSPQKLHQPHLYILHMDTASFLQIRAWLWLPISPSNPQWAKQASQLCQFDFSCAEIMLPFTGASLPSLDTEKSKRIFVLRWQKSPELNRTLTDP